MRLFKNLTQSNTLKTKVNNLEKQTPDPTTLIEINQYNIRKQNLEKKIGDVDKKILDASSLMTTTFLIGKLGKLRTKEKKKVV